MFKAVTKYTPRAVIIIGIIVSTLLCLHAYQLYQQREITAQRLQALHDRQRLESSAVQAQPPTVTVTEEQRPYKFIEKPKSTEDLPDRSAAPGKPYTEPKIVKRQQVPNPQREKAEQQLRETTIEIEAEGLKFKMINEATWSAVFKICFLWLFILMSLAAYRCLIAQIQRRA